VVIISDYDLVTYYFRFEHLLPGDFFFIGVQTAPFNVAHFQSGLIKASVGTAHFTPLGLARAAWGRVITQRP